jgi:ABC-type polysaccharide/polyol phosphate export permease
MNLLFNALYLAWSDVKARYRKSVLGPLWQVLGNLVGVLGLSIVWGNLLKENIPTFVPSLAIGLIIWQLVSASISEGTTVFYKEARLIRNMPMPPWFFIVRLICRHLINFAHNLLIVIGIMIYFGTPLDVSILLFIPNLLLVVANLTWILFLVGFISTRFRDIEYAINSILPILFFVSPVIFRPDRLPEGMEKYLWLNPLSYFIEVMRAPLLGHIADPFIYVILLTMLAVGSFFTYLFYQKYSKRMAFWV